MNSFKYLIFFIGFTFASLAVSGQKLYTKTGEIVFLSEAEVELITAENNKVSCVIDQETGKMQWACLIKAFKFEKALMQEHFNENYMESEKFPKAVFAGSIVEENGLDWDQAGEYMVKVGGQLKIHGVTQEVVLPAKISVSQDGVTANSSFMVKPEDYDIEIPAIVRENIAKSIAVTVNASLQSLK